ncbi:unnamed protein product [Diamesa serratosioi]
MKTYFPMSTLFGLPKRVPRSKELSHLNLNYFYRRDDFNESEDDSEFPPDYLEQLNPSAAIVNKKDEDDSETDNYNKENAGDNYNKRKADFQKASGSKQNSNKKMKNSEIIEKTPLTKTEARMKERMERFEKKVPVTTAPTTSLPEEVLGDWVPEAERFYLPDKTKWLASDKLSTLESTYKHLITWVIGGTKIKQLKNNPLFCDDTIFDDILKINQVVKHLGLTNINSARERCNLFELINKESFLSSSALKMANIDAMCEYMFSSPVNEKGESLIKTKEFLYFADVRSGLGGCAEYIMWRKKWLSKGFTFTVKTDKEFDYTSYSGIKKNGNILDPENIESYVKAIMKETIVGVHFMMADGCDSSEDGKESVQELDAKQVYIAQCLIALSVVRENGHFVIKLLDIYTSFSVSLIFLMYKCFAKITIIKPNMTRSTNSERYLVCKWKRPNIEGVQEHLKSINDEIFKDNNKKEVTILQLVSKEVLKKDKAFQKYILNSNNIIGKQQFIAWKKIVAFHNDPELVEDRQSSIKTQCIQLWDIKEKARIPPANMTNDQFFESMIQAKWYNERFYNAEERSIKSVADISSLVDSVLDWKFVAVGSHKSVDRTIYISRGNNNVFMYNIKKNSWDPINPSIKLFMPAETIIYGEVVTEYSGVDTLQTNELTFHIIDAIILGGNDISTMSLTERNKFCKIFSDSLEGSNGGTKIRTKEMFDVTSANVFYYLLNNREMKDGSLKHGIKINNDDECKDDKDKDFYLPTGLLMMNETRSDKLKQYSRKHDKYYYYNKISKKVEFDGTIQNEEVQATFKNSFTNRFFWNIDQQDQFENRKSSSPKDCLMYQDDIIKFIHDRINRLDYKI